MKRKGRPPTKLVVEPGLLEEVKRLYRTTKNVNTKERAQVILLATEGTRSYQELARTVGRASSTVREWIGRFCESGLDALESRQGQGGGRPSPIQDKEVLDALEEHLRDGTWRTAAEARQWLEEEKGIPRCVSSLRYWMGKLNGALKMPRPVHVKKEPAEAEAFKEHLLENLRGLELPRGSRVKVWVQDEARYGLHTVLRRCWGLKGARVVKSAQQKYQWGYVYGALNVVDGGGEFCYMPTVTLEHVEAFLEQLASSDPEAEHVVIWDGAGFHHRPGDLRLPERIHPLQLPPYSPELNPIEGLWDVVKDKICNRVFETLDAIEEKITEALRPYWEQPAFARSLVGEGWLYNQANNTFANNVPNSFC